MSKVDNPYDRDRQPETYRAWEKGWLQGWRESEAIWLRQMLPIVGELEEDIRYDWEHNDCVQVEKLWPIFSAFASYHSEHEWLQPLIRDAVAAQNANKWRLSEGDRVDLEIMARWAKVELEED